MSKKLTAVREYLQNTLGFLIELQPWTAAANLPRYLSAGRDFFLLNIEGVKCLLIQTDAADFRLSAFKKQIAKLPDSTPEHIALCFDALSAHQRKALIQCGFPFIVPGSQLYLPFLGAMLQERTKPLREAPEKLSPTGQFLLLYYIYRAYLNPVSKVQLTKQLGISAMNVTRAVQELSALGLLTVEKDGRCDRVTAVALGRELYQKATPVLFDPLQKKVYVKQTQELLLLPLAGESALSQRSMLSAPNVECHAIGRKEYKALQSGIETVDPAWSMETDYIQLEIWKYDPCPLAERGCVDPISLSLTFQKQQDERIAQAVDDMMEDYR